MLLDIVSTFNIFISILNLNLYVNFFFNIIILRKNYETKYFILNTLAATGTYFFGIYWNFLINPGIYFSGFIGTFQ